MNYYFQIHKPAWNVERKCCGLKVSAIAKSEQTNIDMHGGFGEDGGFGNGC
jgi:hypothetical protein